MKLLSTLSPAETMLLMRPTCSLKDIMRITFLDLLLKGAIDIKVDTKNIQYTKSSTITKAFNFVIKGAKLNSYNTKEHEQIFLSPYHKSPSIEILFKHFVVMSYENARGKKAFKKKVMNTNLSPYVSINFFQKIFGGFSLTEKGKKSRNDILKHLKYIDENIQHLLEVDKNKALDLLFELGGNVLLLKNYNVSLLKDINKQLLQEYKSTYTSPFSNGGDTWCYFYNENSFNPYLEDFDNISTSFDSDFDGAGCSSGDGGCSSCGGCGGCG